MIDESTTVVAKSIDILEDQVKSFTIMQFANPDLWDKDYHELVENRDTASIGTMIADQLKDKGIEVKEFHIILHDRDLKINLSDQPIDEDEAIFPDNYDFEGDIDDILVPPHYHMYLSIGKRRSITSLSKIIGMNPYRFRKLTRGRYNRPNALSYLIHIKYPEKHLYGPDEVVTIVPNEKDGDYLSIYEKYKGYWLNYRNSKLKKLLKGSASDAEYYDVEAVDTVAEDRYRNYTLVDLLDGINNKVIDIGIIRSSARLRSLAQMYTQAVEKALYEDLDPVNKWYKDEVRNEVYRDNSVPTYQFIYTGQGRTGKTSMVTEVVDDIVAMSSDELHVPFKSFYGGNKGDMSDGYDGEEIAVYDDITSGSADYESFISLDNNFAKGRKAHIRHKSKPYYAMLNFYIMNSNLKSIYYNSKCEDPCGKDKNSFFEKMHYIFDVVERADYRSLHTANVVKFYTYSEYHRDLMNELLEEEGIGIRLDSESFDDEIGLTVYVCSELISLNDSGEIVRVLSKRNQINKLKNLIVEKGFDDNLSLQSARPVSLPETIISENVIRELPDGN